ncbi:mucin-19-like [Leucoraja erinacea]|uniref:mucin-19-like n=1 Tax=Leucoraja erinaceus TaxID=7782 RepID=UPI002458D468|nr:mucin-19-like [Leucoraja erinacea]
MGSKGDKTCSKTQVFENDMKTCNRTCRSLSNYDYTCEVKDVPVFGCGCPEGTYMDKDGACVDKSSCHCYIGREIIKTGQDRTLNGKTCKCENGQLYCLTVPTTTRPGCPNKKVYLDCRNSDNLCAKTCRNMNESCNKISGLCGNYNGDIADDLTTKGNSLVTDILEFGNSWTLSSSYSHVVNQTSACDANPYCLSWAQRKCSIIKHNVFKACHKKVEPIPYYETCVQGACACDLEGKYMGFCTSVAVYAEACNKAEVCIDWRTPDLCPVYCDYYNNPEECSWHYHPCGTLTTRTCSDHYIGKKFSAILEG